MTTWQNAKSVGEKPTPTTWYNPLLQRLGAVDDVAAFKGSPASYIIFKSGSIYYAMDGTTGDVSTITPGVDEATVINAAMAALTAGRTWKEKVLCKGEFTIDSTLVIPSYTILEVQGKLTAKASLEDSMINNSVGVGMTAYTDPGSRNVDIEICGGTIDGNKANQTNPTDNHDTINMQGATNLNVHDIQLVNGWTEGLRTSFCENVQICNNYFENSADDCIAVNKETLYAVIDGNICLNAGLTTSYGAACGIEVQDGCHHVVVSNNVCYGNAADGIQVSAHAGEAACYDIVITGNVCYGNTTNGMSLGGRSGAPLLKTTAIGNVCSGNTERGIVTSYAEKITIQGNLCAGNQRGIRPADSSYVHVKGNTVIDNDYSGIEIEADCTYCFIIGNDCIDNGAAVAGAQVGIAVFGDANHIENNFVADTRAGAARTQSYGLVTYAGGDSNIIKYNTFLNHPTANVQDAGATNVFKLNYGWVTENSGSDAVINGQTSKVVTHGCDYTPTAKDVTITQTAATTNPSYITYVDTFTSTQFTVHVSADPGASTFAFDWAVRKV